MTSPQTVSPRSTLAATRKHTAPWGLVPSPAPGALSGTARGALYGAPPAEPPTGSDRSAVPLASHRSAGEQRLIALLVAAALGVTLALATLGAQASKSLANSEQRIGSTLGRASLQQMEFHAQHARFAIWEELSRSGAKLPPNVTVVRSNASLSHWYLRLRDQTTGLTCDRVGQLIDPPADRTTPNCTRSP